METAQNNTDQQPSHADLDKQTIDALCGDISSRREQTVRLRKPPAAAEKTATCQCCDTEGIKMSNMTEIDSGQLLCRECLADLKGA
jgi:hypothetical protein